MDNIKNNNKMWTGCEQETKWHVKTGCVVSRGKVVGGEFNSEPFWGKGRLHDTHFWTSTVFYSENMGGGGTPLGGTRVSQNTLSNLVRGDNVFDRIGGLIKPINLKIMLQLSAAIYNKPGLVTQTTGNDDPTTLPNLIFYPSQPISGEESFVGSKDHNICCTKSYVRTTYRILVIKDHNQEEMESMYIPWTDVMMEGKTRDTTYGGDIGTIGGVFTMQKPESMSRFEVLVDEIVQLEAGKPQLTMCFEIDGKKIGNIRYKENEFVSKASKGIYVLFGAMTTGVSKDLFLGDDDDRKLPDEDEVWIKLPPVIQSSFLSFTDS